MYLRRRLFCLITLFALIEFTHSTWLSAQTPEMVLVPAEDFSDIGEFEFIGVGAINALRETRKVHPHSFYIDRTEVTNEQYKKFLDDTGYKPKWPENFLKHWRKGTYARGRATHPVVCVSFEDAEAYATWAGKRLPTEEEWQMAAQGPDGRRWPWGNQYSSVKANFDSEGTMPVGSYPQGASPYGCLDMAGNVWEWTAPVHTDGYHLFSWLRGGSFFLAKGSFWYKQSGPITAYQRVHFLHFTPAYNRCASVGFRCAKDIN
jgi:formylglycine-generating enzyme required for sulfatase activity